MHSIKNYMRSILKHLKGMVADDRLLCSNLVMNEGDRDIISALSTVLVPVEYAVAKIASTKTRENTDMLT